MVIDEAILKRAQAAIEVDPRINLHAFPLHMEVQDHQLLLDGDVESVAAKRLAVRLAGCVDGIQGVVDNLHVVPAESRADGEILDSLTQLLLGQIDLKNCTIERSARGRIELLHEALGDDYDRSGRITFSVDDGVVSLDGHVISLTHRRLAEVLAWWVPGSCDVLNRLAVYPPEQDGDDEVNDAVRLALEMDPLLSHADQINVSTSQGIVALKGAIGSDEERQMAEFDVWCVGGVKDVENRLEVTR